MIRSASFHPLRPTDAESSTVIPAAAHTYLALPLILQDNLGKVLALLQELWAVGLPLLQLHKETLLIKKIIYKWIVKSSAKSLGPWCYTHTFKEGSLRGASPVG